MTADPLAFFLRIRFWVVADRARKGPPMRFYPGMPKEIRGAPSGSGRTGLPGPMAASAGRNQFFAPPHGICALGFGGP